MNKLLLGTILLALSTVVSNPTLAQVNINVGIALPPLITFEAPPDVIVMPDTNNVYVVPDIDIDLFFWSGWWWRPWEGRWYRSYYYNRGWAYYNRVPSFYFDVDPGWRGHYRDHNWYGHRWDYERIPNKRLQQNWKSWNNNRYWEKQRTWSVQSYQPRPQQQRQELRQQRQEQYHQMPEVQRHQQQMEQQRQSQVKKPQGQQQRQPQVQQPQQQQHQPPGQQHQGEQQPQQQHSQPPGQQHQGGSQHQQYQGKPEGEDAEHKK